MIRALAIVVVLVSILPSFAQDSTAPKAPAGGVFRVGGGVSAPKVVFSPEPQCTDRANAAKQQGTEILWLVVGSDGVPRDIHVHTSLGADLDQRAIETVQTWRFEPSEKEGRPVAVQINLQVKFDCEGHSGVQSFPIRQNSKGSTNKNSTTALVDVLSDTQGVDFGPYLQAVIGKVRRNWYALIPVPAQAPVRKKGKVSIEFQILPGGEIHGLKYALSSGDVDLDRAAWWGIENSNPFPSLPSGFNGPNLALRFSFFYNPDAKDLKGTFSPGGLPSTSTPNTSPPSILFAPPPQYTKPSRIAKEEGSVILSVTVDKHGKARQIAVVKSLSKDLDKKAIQTVKKWEFKSGTKDGKRYPHQCSSRWHSN